jgi:7-cyano-7-deazaguanine synthase
VSRYYKVMEDIHPDSSHAVVLLSGGLDSATVTACLKQKGVRVTALSIDYGQRHSVELEAARHLAKVLEVDHHYITKLDMDLFQGSALTDKKISVPKGDFISDNVSEDIPITYVPARNTIFLSLGLGLAESLNANCLGIGVNALDYSGYPDCRPEFVQKFSELSALATKSGVEGNPIRIYTPLLNMKKLEILRLANELGVPIDRTVSCYDPLPSGDPCTLCDSCRLRLQAEGEWEGAR